MADDQPAATPKRRTSTRRPKGDAQPPATIEPEVIEVGSRGSRAAAAARPVVVEDGASLDAEQVEIHRSAVGRVEASQVGVSQGAIGAARAENVTVEQGAVGAVLGEHVEVSRGFARSILARQVQLDRAAARVVIAADVRTNQTAVVFLVARKVAGDVRVLFDWRGAIAFGAALGAVYALVRRARRPR
jgi:hypothetical protein